MKTWTEELNERFKNLIREKVVIPNIKLSAVKIIEKTATDPDYMFLAGYNSHITKKFANLKKEVETEEAAKRANAAAAGGGGIKAGKQRSNK